MFKEIKEKYSNLESEVHLHLADLIMRIGKYSKHIQNCKSISVNVFDYTELVLHEGSLKFLDSNGHHYSLYAECSLEDLVDILVGFEEV